MVTTTPHPRCNTLSQVVLREFARNRELTMHDAEREVLITKGPRAGFHMEFAQTTRCC